MPITNRGNMASVFSPMSRTAVTGCRAINNNDRSSSNSKNTNTMSMSSSGSATDGSSSNSGSRNGQITENTNNTTKAATKFVLPKMEQNGFRHFREWASLAP